MNEIPARVADRPAIGPPGFSGGLGASGRDTSLPVVHALLGIRYHHELTLLRHEHRSRHQHADHYRHRRLFN